MLKFVTGDFGAQFDPRYSGANSSCVFPKFPVMHQVGKYSPTRLFTFDAPITVLGMVQKSPAAPRAELERISTAGYGDPRGTSSPDGMLPPPHAKIRMSKGAIVKAVRRYPSPQPTSIESLEAAWVERRGCDERAKRSADGRSPSKPGADASDPQANSPDGAQPPRSRRRAAHPDVRTIFSPAKDPRVKEETGEGHCFVATEATTWCDLCCGYILLDCRICSGCKYTCHAACQHRVALDCQPGHGTATEAQLNPLSQDRLNNNNTLLTNVEKDRERRTQLSGEEIRQKVEQYNTLTKDHLKMTLIPSGEYTGFIKVQLELRRPVTVRGGPGLGGAGEEAFYLPRGATNTLHISSNSTVQQVIVALLKKSKVADNPAKYALYKRYSREEQVYVCKLAEVEKPLYLRLVAGPDADTFGFVLREQQTGEVMWEAFSIPELMNFLRFLEKEEKEHAEAIVSRYDNYRQKLQEALRANQGAP